MGLGLIASARSTQHRPHARGFGVIALLGSLGCGPSSRDGDGAPGSSSAATEPAGTDGTTTGDATAGSRSTGALETSVGEATAGATSTGGPPPATTASTGGRAESGSSGGSDLLCPGITDCEVLPFCEFWECGNVNSPLDEFGCPRPRCEDRPCPEGYRCHAPWETCTVCHSWLFQSEASKGAGGPTCVCGEAEDCDARFCVPDTIPVDDCQRG